MTPTILRFDLTTSITSNAIKEINKGFVIDKFVVISEHDIDKNLNVEIKYRNNFHLGRKK